MEPSSPPILLQGLRDIHTPDAISSWPPAPGWWMLTGLLVLAVIFIGILYHRRTATRRAALLELEKIRNTFQLNGDTQQLAMKLSILMRRLALADAANNEAASLINEDWLKHLDKEKPTTPFSKGYGQILATAPYQKHPSLDGERLLQLVHTWIKEHA